MKIATKKMMVLMLIVGMLAALAAGCGKKDSNNFEGKWIATKISTTGVEANVKEYVEAQGSEYNEEDFMMELKSDGTFSMNFQGASQDGKWKEVSSDTVELTDAEGNDPITCKIEDGNLIFDLSSQGVDVKMIMEKK